MDKMYIHVERTYKIQTNERSNHLWTSIDTLCWLLRRGTVRIFLEITVYFNLPEAGQKYSLLTLIMETFSLHTNEADSGNDLSLFCDGVWRFVTWRNAIFASHRPSLSENVSISCDQKSESRSTSDTGCHVMWCHITDCVTGTRRGDAFQNVTEI